MISEAYCKSSNFSSSMDICKKFYGEQDFKAGTATFKFQWGGGKTTKIYAKKIAGWVAAVIASPLFLALAGLSFIFKEGSVKGDFF